VVSHGGVWHTLAAGVATPLSALLLPPSCLLLVILSALLLTSLLLVPVAVGSGTAGGYYCCCWDCGCYWDCCYWCRCYWCRCWRRLLLIYSPGASVLLLLLGLWPLQVLLAGWRLLVVWLWRLLLL